MKLFDIVEVIYKDKTYKGYYIQKAEEGFLVAIGKDLNKGNWEFVSPNIQVITDKVKEL